jgi:hypothetical protein
MREDMAKLLVERPRRGGLRALAAKKVQLKEDDDGAIQQEAMRKRWRERKEFNEYFAPLKRYIQSQVGRPWNKVYSEICQRINRSSAIQIHILQHLEDFVQEHVFKVGDDFYSLRTRYRVWDRYFYVDPDSGLLCQVPTEFGKKAFPNNSCIRWKNNDPRTMTQYHRAKGVWYEVGIMPVPGNVSVEPCYDHLHKCMVDSQEQYRDIYGGLYYAASKRQLNSKEIKRLGSLLGGKQQ